jgi:hypothetical protein
MRYADAVITVTSQIARLLERSYGICDVKNVLNAEPFMEDIHPSYEHPVNQPFQFLCQGSVTTGRGFEELLDAWETMDNEGAVLILSCPEYAGNPYLNHLLAKHDGLLKKGGLRLVAPVREKDLV